MAHVKPLPADANPDLRVAGEEERWVGSPGWLG